MIKRNKIAALKYRLNHILSAQILRLFQPTKQMHFEFGDKPQKLLACQLHKLQDERTIYKIRSDKGDLLTLPKDINDRFLNYYQTLYSAKTHSSVNMQHFMQKCNLSGLNEIET